MSKRDIIINLVTKAKDDGLKALDKGLDNVGRKAEKTGGLFSRFGDNVGKNLTGKLGVAGDAADNLGLGLDDLKGTTALAGAGIAAFGGFVAGGVKKMKELYDQTRDFNEVAGTSWEEGSRLIAVFDDLRVNADEGAGAMGRLTKTVGSAPEKLEEYGIEVARAKDGTVDMVGTLANVATAFENTTDPAKRAKLGNDLFGRSWQQMVPVLQRGGDELRDLAAAVDDSQVATAEGAKQQDELFEATDNLNDAIDGLQRSLAKDVIPTLADFAEHATTVVNALSKVNDIVPVMDVLTKSLPGPGMLSQAKDIWSGLKKEFGDVGDKVGPLAKDMGGVNEQLALGAKVGDLAAGAVRGLNAAAQTQIVRAKDAKASLDDWRKSTEDLLQAQEDMRLAQLGAIDTSLALTEANRSAGDASFELSDAAHVVENAVRDYGAGSEQAAIATEEHRRALDRARSAVDQAADAEVAHAVQMAATRNETLTAAEQVKVYRDKLIDLKEGVEDPALADLMQRHIDFLAETARQAQNAAENLQGYNEAVFESKGGEREFTGRNAGGQAVVRRATGGPVWPGRTYHVEKDELIRLPLGTSPGEVLSVPESQRVNPSRMPSVIRRDADGTVSIGSQTGAQVYSSGQYSFPTLGALDAARGAVGGSTPSAPGVVSRLGLSPDEAGVGLTTKSMGLGGGTLTININGVVGERDAVIRWIVEGLRRYGLAVG